MTTMHNRQRLPRQDFLDTGAEVRQVEAAHAASEIDDEPRNTKPLHRYVLDWLHGMRATWRWLKG